jgi:hypothetical protein
MALYVGFELRSGGDALQLKALLCRAADAAPSHSLPSPCLP